MRARASVIALCAGAALAATPSAGAAVRVTTAPKLVPPFRAGVEDHVVRCRTGTPVRVKVHATGGDEVAVADGHLDTGTFHADVMRLTGAAFTVRVRHRGRSTTHHVRCLPRDFPSWTVTRRGIPQAQWYVTDPVEPPAGGYVAIFDSRGTPVWWWRVGSRSFMPWDAKLLTRQLLAWGKNFGNHFGVRAEGAYEEQQLDGTVVRRIGTHGSPTDVHDFERMQNGHLLMITYHRRDGVDLSSRGGPRHARVFDGEVQELTPDGRVAWRWNSHGHVRASETQHAWWYNEAAGKPPPPERGYDLLHLNSVQEDGAGLIVSARHTNAVYRIDRKTGRIDWKLGGSLVAGESLTVVGVPPGEQVFGGQHDARLLPDGTLSVYDNRGYTSGSPAAVRFRIDRRARTATRIEHVTNPAVTKSQWGGSARKLPGGNWVIAWGGTSLVTEQRPSGATVLALRLGSHHITYRADALAPGRLPASALRRGMDRIAWNHTVPR